MVNKVFTHSTCWREQKKNLNESTVLLGTFVTLLGQYLNRKKLFILALEHACFNSKGKKVVVSISVYKFQYSSFELRDTALNHYTSTVSKGIKCIEQSCSVIRIL